MKRIIIACATVLALAGCAPTDPQGAERTLTRAGYTEIQVAGYDWFACGRDDTYHTKFKAKGPTGIPVTGVVCKGFWGKASTIRFED